MTIFEELCKQYNDKREKSFEYIRKCAGGAAKLADSIYKYIDAPDYYMTIEDNNLVKKNYKYVDISFVDIYWKETGRNFTSLKDMFFDANGFLRFDIIVTLEPGRNAFPKTAYRIHCGIRTLEGQQYLVFVNKPEDREIYKEFLWEPGDVAKTGPEQYIVDMIAQSLNDSMFL